MICAVWIARFDPGPIPPANPKHLPVAEFIHPDVFSELKEIGLQKGFRFVESGPLVRSSYHAEKHLF